jgi:hypothetical protein
LRQISNFGVAAELVGVTVLIILLAVPGLANELSLGIRWA